MFIVAHCTIIVAHYTHEIIITKQKKTTRLIVKKNKKTDV